MKRAWAWWCALWDGEEHPIVMSAVRVLLALTILADLFEAWHLGLVVPLWGPGAAGGIGDPEHRSTVTAWYQLMPATPESARTLFYLLVAATLSFGAGFLTPLACLVWVLLYAQVALILPAADRGIDMMLRNVVLLMAFIPNLGRGFGVDRLLFGAKASIPSWSRRLLVLQLVVMYFTAGIQKTAVAWWPWGGFSALFLVLQDVAVARFPFEWLQRYYPLTQLLSASTMVFELAAPLVLLAHFYRRSRTRSGWLRAQLNRVGILPYWLPVGLLMHLGIAATMQIGLFPWAMMAMYPAFFHPDLVLRTFGLLGEAGALGHRDPQVTTEAR